MHDFGRVVALSCLEEILVSASSTIRLSPQRVCQVVEAYHVEIGMVMAEKWSLPPVVADVIRDHHYMPGSSSRDYVDLVRATDLIVALMETSLLVEREDLDSIASLSPEERDYVADLLPALPGLVEGLDPQAGAALPRISQYMRIQVDATDPTSVEDLIHHADLDATCRVFGDDNRCNVIGIGPRRLQLLSTRAYAPQTVVQLTLAGDDGPFRMWCTLSSIRQQMRRTRPALRPRGQAVRAHGDGQARLGPAAGRQHAAARRRPGPGPVVADGGRAPPCSTSPPTRRRGR